MTIRPKSRQSNRALRAVVRMPVLRIRWWERLWEAVCGIYVGARHWLSRDRVSKFAAVEVRVARNAVGQRVPMPAVIDGPVRIDHPILLDLQRRAAAELFLWLGIEWIPGAFYAILEREPDPGRSIEIFARSLGCDAMQIRRRDPRELSRFQAIVSLTKQLETDGDALTRTQRNRLEAMLRFGRFDRADQVTRTLAGLNEARDLYRHGATAPIARLKRETAEVEMRRRNAFEATDEEVDETLDRAIQMDRLVREFALATERWNSIEPVLLALGEVMSADVWHPFADRMARADVIRRDLMHDSNADVAVVVAEYTRVIAELDANASEQARMFRSESAPSGRRLPRRRRKVTTGLPDLAKAFFAMKRSVRPDAAAIDLAFLTATADTAPPRGHSDPDARATKLRDAIAWRHILLEEMERDGAAVALPAA